MKSVNYQQLNVWQKSIDLVQLIYAINKKLPSEERYVLGSQILRASISIPCNISEGYGRAFKKEKKQFFTISYSSSLELGTQLIIINKIYPKIDIQQAEQLNTEVQKMLNAYIRQII